MLFPPLPVPVEDSRKLRWCIPCAEKVQSVQIRGPVLSLVNVVVQYLINWKTKSKPVGSPVCTMNPFMLLLSKTSHQVQHLKCIGFTSLAYWHAVQGIVGPTGRFWPKLHHFVNLPYGRSMTQLDQIWCYTYCYMCNGALCTLLPLV